MGQRGRGRPTRRRAWALLGLLVAGALLTCALMGTFAHPGAQGDTATGSPSSDSDGKPAVPLPRGTDEPLRTGSWKSGQALEDQAQALLADYRDEGRCVLAQAGYLDLAGRVWSCVVAGDGWVDLCVVRASEDGGSDVSVQRMEASAWEEEVDAAGGTDGDAA